jgi:CHASE3 domain sensor protein
MDSERDRIGWGERLAMDNREREKRNRYDDPMESGGLGDLFGDPEELQRRLAEFAEQMQGNQSLAWADNAIKLAVEMTVAAVERINLQGNAEAQADQIRTVMARVFPEAVTLVREARAGLQ